MTVQPVADKPARARYLLPLLFAAALAGMFLFSLFSGDPSRLPSALIGKPAPQFDLPPIEGFTKNGQPGAGFRTADLSTGEVSLVNIWASWCAPCIQEHPLLVRLKERHGLRLIGINYKDQPENAQRFLARLGDPYDLIGADRDGRTAIDWGVYGVPETYVVDGGGQIVYRYVGPLTEEAIERDLLPVVEAARRGSG